MKLINLKNDVAKIRLDSNELDIVNQVLNVPLNAFGLEEFLLEAGVSKEKIETINDKLGDLSKKTEEGKVIEVDFKANELHILEKSFEAACSVINRVDDIQTLTGYSRREALMVQKRLKEITDQLSRNNS